MIWNLEDVIWDLKGRDLEGRGNKGQRARCDAIGSKRLEVGGVRGRGCGQEIDRETQFMAPTQVTAPRQ